MSKRKLLRLVKDKVVDGWDDPRMPTICGMRRRGVTPAALRAFCEKVGVTQNNSTIDSALLDECIREDLDPVVERRFAVLDPVKVVIETLNEPVSLTIPNHPLNPDLKSRDILLTRTIYIEREDFREDPPADYFRLKPNGRCKLRNAFVIKCLKVVKDETNGKIIEIHCSHEPETLTTSPKEDGVTGVIHWVSAEHCVSKKVSIFNPLILEEQDESAENDWINNLNPESRITYEDAKLEISLKDPKPMDRFQFVRVGFFVFDEKQGSFNRIVALKESGLKKEESASNDNRSRKEEQARQKAAKDALKSVKPADFFKRQGEGEKYSEWDQEGLPTKDAEGKEITKSMSKKLAKELEKHRRFYNEANGIFE
jgi:glutaminyl-tRNA synthetase